ncbi:unnamed protein product [Paramecium pentaurelia]|uniref:Uncharacterized protein n=1 Tax=Paramecium pentaurelia TaxID=43138 RepID=A0A8S1YJ06_9CILI|nr:unnamed protein product [Paramecium pentaurelia]
MMSECHKQYKTYLEYTQIWENKCATLGACTSYDGININADDNLLILKNLYIFQIYYQKIRAQTCEDNRNNQSGCAKNVEDCLYYQTKSQEKITFALCTLPEDQASDTENKDCVKELPIQETINANWIVQNVQIENAAIYQQPTQLLHYF